MNKAGTCVKLRNPTTSTLFFKLHWLAATHRVQIHNTKFQLSASIPSLEHPISQFLSDLLQRYTPTRQLRSASDTRTLVTPGWTQKQLVKERFLTLADPFEQFASNTRHSHSSSSFKAAPVQCPVMLDTATRNHGPTDYPYIMWVHCPDCVVSWFGLAVRR